jgi:hypothetical protein
MSAVLPLADLKMENRLIPATRRIFSFPVMVSSLLIALAFLTVRSRFNDPDMWWHLKSGEIIATTRMIPTTDTFSYTSNHQSTIPHEWLSQLFIYGAYKAGGYRGLMLWLSVLTSCLLVGGYCLCSLYSGNAKVGFVGAVALWTFSTVGLAIRPHMVGYLLLVGELIFIHLGSTRNPRWFLALPPLFAVWINSHGSFFLGIIVLGIYVFGSFFHFRAGALFASRWDSSRQRLLILCFILSIAALFLNPVGAKQVFYPLDTLLHQPINLSQIYEWQPLQLNQGRGAALLVVLGCFYLLALVRNSELSLQELLLLAVGTWMAVSHERMLFSFGILVAPILSRLLSGSWEKYDAEIDRPALNAAFIAGSLLIAIWAFPSSRNIQAQIDDSNPANAVKYLDSHNLTGPMLNEYAFGGYLIWAAPNRPVFIDGRADVYEWAGVLKEFSGWATLQDDPRKLLDKYKVEICLLAPHSPMVTVLPLMDWKRVYSDDESVIFVRGSALNQ